MEGIFGNWKGSWIAEDDSELGAGDLVPVEGSGTSLFAVWLGIIHFASLGFSFSKCEINEKASKLSSHFILWHCDSKYEIHKTSFENPDLCISLASLLSPFWVCLLFHYTRGSVTWWTSESLKSFKNTGCWLLTPMVCFPFSCGAQESTFPASSQTMLMLLAPGPRFENRYTEWWEPSLYLQRTQIKDSWSA